MSEPATQSTPRPDGIIAEGVPQISDIGEAAWTACLPADTRAANPFISYAFLNALEETGCVGPTETGWIPQHLVLKDARQHIMAVAPNYVKLHSRGEYVFDHAWAEATHRSGLSYYPKLQIAVPFTPVPGPRLLIHPDHDPTTGYDLFASALIQLTERLEASSAHLTFLDKGTWDHLGTRGFLRRMDQQFHWYNNDYHAFDDFLATLTSRKRKTIRKERRQAQDSNLTFRICRGDDITEADWDVFFEFYLDTGTRKWGDPYLNRAFFSALGETLSDACVLMFALDEETPVAGALHLLGGDCLYGRYWGAKDYHPFLHFELCYYQAMDFAIEYKIPRLEAGAQGEHKLLRGYMPTPTYSAHWIANHSLRAAIARYLDQERRDVEQSLKMLANYGPYKSD